MLDLNYIFDKWGIPKGVIHINPQFFFARNVYLRCGLFNTIWIESNTFFYNIGINQVLESEKLFNLVISSDPHIVSHKLDDVQSKSLIQNKNLNQIFEENNLNSSDYDFINISLSVKFDIESFLPFLSNLKSIVIEVTRNVDSDSDFKKIDKILNSLRFKKVEIVFRENLGQAFYIKKRKYTKR